MGNFIIIVFTGSCDFEEKSFCTWLNVPNGNRSIGLDDFDWTLGSGSTPSWQTGPSTDHTTGTSLGKSLCDMVKLSLDLETKSILPAIITDGLYYTDSV